jgi:DNA-binding transcriptional LysR family regulator
MASRSHNGNGKDNRDGPNPFDGNQRTLAQTPLDDPRLLSGPFWGELRVFLAVAKAKSFNRAAKQLGMSQPTVSRQVRRLQDVMGSQLVVCSANDIALTDKGRDLAQALIALDEKLFEIAHELRAETRDAEGMVRVSVTEALAGLFLAPKLAAFSEHYPKIQLHIRNPANLTAFRENQTDIMLSFLPGSGSVQSRQCGYVHLIPQASKDYIEHFGMPTRTNLETHFFLDTEYYSAKTGVWDAWQNAVGRGVVSHYCDNSFAYALMAKSGLGIALLGSYTLADPVSIPLDIDVHIALPIYILAMTERLQSKPIRLVYDWLCEVFSPDIPWFAKTLNLSTPPNLMGPTLDRVAVIPGPKP